MQIYKITNTINNKSYIGKTTKSIQTRFKCHCYNSRQGSTYLYKAMRKYGIDNFIIETIETVESNIDEREVFWIATIKPEYNMTAGGDGGDTSNSPNYKLGMAKRDISGSKNPMFGIPRPDTAVYLTKAKSKMIESNSCPVVCEGIEYSSVAKAQEAYPGISIRKRLDNIL